MNKQGGSLLSMFGVGRKSSEAKEQLGKLGSQLKEKNDELEKITQEEKAAHEKVDSLKKEIKLIESNLERELKNSKAWLYHKGGKSKTKGSKKAKRRTMKK